MQYFGRKKQLRLHHARKTLISSPFRPFYRRNPHQNFIQVVLIRKQGYIMNPKAMFEAKLYRLNSMFSDRKVLAKNSADPDKSPSRNSVRSVLHCLPFHLHLLNAVLYFIAELFSFYCNYSNFLCGHNFRILQFITYIQWEGRLVTFELIIF